MSASRSLLLAALPILAPLLVGCAAEPPPAQAPATAGQLLPRPYTAQQIRDEWIPGFTLEVSRNSPPLKVRERWTILSADDEGAELETTALGDDGTPGTPQVNRVTWIQLRDHASFPQDQATREEVTRDTPLGTLDGWLYVVRGEDDGTVSEYFFAHDLPGAPVRMRTTRGEQLLMEMVQLSRQRPD